jgi:hypothetical protein
VHGGVARPAPGLVAAENRDVVGERERLVVDTLGHVHVDAAADEERVLKARLDREHRLGLGAGVGVVAGDRHEGAEPEAQVRIVHVAVAALIDEIAADLRGA